MTTWADREGVRHLLAYARPADRRRSRNPMTWVTRCSGQRTNAREHRAGLNPTCIDCILEED